MVRFILSCDPFSGFEFHISRDSLVSMEYVIEQIQQELEMILKRHHLEILVQLWKSKPLYYHHYSLLDVLSNEDENKEWYICECPPP